MKKWFIRINLGLALLAAVAGCSKGGMFIPDEDDGPHVIIPTDTIPPVLEMLTPSPNQVFSSGTAISITGKISDGLGLYQGYIRITNDANNALVKEQLYEIHGILQYNFNISHTATVTTSTDYTITVSFEDHGLNSTSKSVKIKVNP